MNALSSVFHADTASRILPVIKERWSPRSFDASAIPAEDLATILHAATLAPSAYNAQPWHFLYAHHADEAGFAKFLEPLVAFNQSWAHNASVLLYILSREKMDGPDGPVPNHSHSFDAGAAWAMMALQATELGYHTHGMTGVDFDAARKILQVPEGYRIEAAIAIGRQAPAEHLPEGLRTREARSDRKPVAEVSTEGPFA